MSVSDVAKIADLTNEAIRFYEEKGLVTPPARSEGGYHTYTQQHLNELALLRQARQVAEIERHIKELQSMHDQLLALANTCPGDDGTDCPVIENLSGCYHHRAG